MYCQYNTNKRRNKGEKRRLRESLQLHRPVQQLSVHIIPSISEMPPGSRPGGIAVFLSAKLRAGGHAVVQHEKMQLFLAVHLAHGGQEHAVGHLPHHLARREVEDSHDRLAD